MGEFFLTSELVSASSYPDFTTRKKKTNRCEEAEEFPSASKGARESSYPFIPLGQRFSLLRVG